MNREVKLGVGVLAALLILLACTIAYKVYSSVEHPAPPHLATELKELLHSETAPGVESPYPVVALGENAAVPTEAEPTPLVEPQPLYADVTQATAEMPVEEPAVAAAPSETAPRFVAPQAGEPDPFAGRVDDISTLPDEPTAPVEPQEDAALELPAGEPTLASDELSDDGAQPAQHVQTASQQPAPKKSLLRRVEDRLEAAEHAIAERAPGVIHRVEEGIERAESAVVERMPGIVHGAEQEAERLEEGAVRAEEAIKADVAAGAHRLAEERHEVYDAVRGREHHPEHVAQHHDRYTVEPNDNYWAISKKLYGSGAYFKALYRHNRAGFPRADELRPGDVIATPDVAVLREKYPEYCPSVEHQQQAQLMHQVSGSRHLPRGDHLYVVEEGDTLFDIARYELGNASRWVEIYDLNRQVLGQNFDYLPPGLELALPGNRGSRSDSVTEVPSQRLQR